MTVGGAIYAWGGVVDTGFWRGLVSWGLRTSRATFLVRQGAWNSSARFLPAMPPTTLSGMATRAKSATMMAMVGAGSAAVELLCHAIEFRKANTQVSGRGKMSAVRKAREDEKQRVAVVRGRSRHHKGGEDL